jgi:predicted nucleic acid-binding protein
VGAQSARSFLQALAAGEHTLVFVSRGTLRRAVAIDARFADLDLGFVDGCVMALAERIRLAILALDFDHFRATRPERGFWHLVVDEARYAEKTGRL